MPGSHAVLSPSSAERWITCPGSIALSEQVPRQGESGYALEGTVAHALGELKAAFHFGQIDAGQYSHRRRFWRRTYAAVLDGDEVETEMDRHTDAYVSFLQERVDAYPMSQIFLEQRLPTGLPDDGSGTSDAVIVSPVHLEIVDLKYGQGVFVVAKGNPQLRLYGGGALDTYGDILGDTKLVRLSVFQPRMDNVDFEELAADELRSWRAEVAIPAGVEALGPDAHFQPSDKACMFCPASGRCRAQLEAVFAEPMTDPLLLSPEEIAEWLGRLPALREWLKAFEEAALTQAYSEGTAIPGYKVVLSGGQRRVGAEALTFLTGEAGYTFDEVGSVRLRGIGELEKLMGKEKFAELLAPYITKSEGRPSLVPEDDKRPAVAPNTEAQKEFSE